MAPLADAVTRYAPGLHAAAGGAHHVASPLGAWLVLALAGSAARDEEAERLGDVLGLPVAEAAQAARALLDDPHPAVAAAAAAWTAPGGDDVAHWLDGLPATVARGPVPSPAEADAWARERTLGLVERFPLDLDRDWVCVLASALATRVTWLQPFDVVDAEGFRSPWRDRVGTVLRSPGLGHGSAIVRHPDAGDLAVHRADADGLVVTSVLAGPDVAPGRVLAAAHDAARDRVAPRSLFDLPLGDGPSWTITEHAGDDGEERITALLPAWSVQSEHDLTPPGAGFDVAAGVLMRLFGAGGPWDARQVAVARYDARGFEAAAVTGLFVAESAFRRSPGRRRDALLRFDRPYAVVATTYSTGPWYGLPVFSAWVAEPGDG